MVIFFHVDEGYSLSQEVSFKMNVIRGYLMQKKILGEKFSSYVSGLNRS